MNARVTSPDVFREAFAEIYKAFAHADATSYHPNLVHRPDEIIKALADKNLLRWRYPTWYSTNQAKCTALLVCEIGYNFKFGKKSLCEFIWMSSDKRSGVALFRLAEKFAEENGIEMLGFTSVCGSPSHEKLDKFYTNNNFSKDCITYTKLL